MYSFIGIEEFLSEIKSLDDRLKNLKLNAVEIDRENAGIKYVFICDNAVDGELEKKILDSVCKNTISVFTNIEISVKKIVSNDELIKNCISQYLKDNYPSISIFLKDTDVIIQNVDNFVKYTLRLTPDGVEYVNKNGAIKKLNEYLGKSFCSEFGGSTLVKDREEIVDLSSEEVFESELKRIEHRTIKVNDVVVIDDANMGNLALYIEDAVSGDAVVCGKITDIGEKQTKNGKPFFVIRIDDTTGNTSGVYFTKKNTYQKIKDLKVDDAIISRVRIGEYNGKKSVTFDKINRCSFPSDFVKKDKYKKSVPTSYSTVFPEDLTVVSVKSMFEKDDKLPEEIMSGEYVVFDIETTGLDILNDGITEIGAVKIKNGKICEKWTTFVKPDQAITSKITELTGITNEMVKDAPKISTVIPDFLKFSENAVLVAHNADFDVNFMKRFAKAEDYEIKNKVEDTMILSRKYLSLPKNDLHTVAEHFGVVFNHHRAFDDALATAKCFLELEKIAQSKENV